MDERYTRYIENLRRVRALARPEAHAGMKAADLLEEIKQNAAESYTLMQQSNAILDEVIFSRRAENLTEEEAAGLSEFAGKLFNGIMLLPAAGYFGVNLFYNFHITFLAAFGRF